jgi:hypothetical protein
MNSTAPTASAMARMVTTRWAVSPLTPRPVRNAFQPLSAGAAGTCTCAIAETLARAIIMLSKSFFIHDILKA